MWTSRKVSPSTPEILWWPFAWRRGSAICASVICLLVFMFGGGAGGGGEVGGGGENKVFGVVLKLGNSENVVFWGSSLLPNEKRTHPCVAEGCGGGWTDQGAAPP